MRLKVQKKKELRTENYKLICVIHLCFMVAIRKVTSEITMIYPGFSLFSNFAFYSLIVRKWFKINYGRF